MTMIAKLPGELSPALFPDRESPYLLQDVYERLKGGIREELVLQCDGGYLLFRADVDTDSLEVDFHEGDLKTARKYRSIRSAAPWDQHIGRECGWTWLTVNQQGYCDGALISFDGLIPSVLINVTASSLYVMSVQGT